MTKRWAFALGFLGLFIVYYFQPAQAQPVKVKGEAEVSKVTPYTLFFPFNENRVILEPQKIDYDLTQKNVIRLGPYLLTENLVSLQMTREQGEFVDVEFGLELRKRKGSVYVISFRWPTDYLRTGTLEIINEKGESFWRKPITETELASWKDLLEQKSVSNEDMVKLRELPKDQQAAIIRPQKLNAVHARSVYGLAHKGFVEIPIAQIKEPFRFCVRKEDGKGQVALCSRQYKFIRKFGVYSLSPVQKSVRPRVLVNDKEVTLKGTAIFLDYETPIKFAALLQNGTYYEFISKPKEIKVVDLIYDSEKDDVNIIGYGDQPMGQVDESFYADSVHWGFLNFMPTIGDLRKFWRASASPKAPYVYLRGDGGAPFRQAFNFESLPTTKARIELSDESPKTTYKSVTRVRGSVNPEISLSSDGTDVNRISPTEFSWDFLAPKQGEQNIGLLNVKEGEQIWKAQYEIYRGFPAEFGVRLNATASLELDLVLLGEVAGQYWFEDVLGWENYTFSKLRWGLAAKYFSDVAVAETDGPTQGIVSISAATVDLKYRFTPGIWGRDPSVGALLSYSNFSYGFRQSGTDFVSTNTIAGGGLFWARSMPRFFDDIFNILPFFRYPKWVDMEMIWYPVSLEAEKSVDLNVAFNFHGKVQWTPRLYGEAGFGIKTFGYNDPTIGTLGKRIALGLVYGSFGVGLNF